LKSGSLNHLEPTGTIQACTGVAFTYREQKEEIRLRKKERKKKENTIAMSFHTIQNRNPLKPQVRFDNMDDVYKAKLKLLGIYITEKQKCNVQVGSLSPKLSKVCYIIMSLKDVMSGVSKCMSCRRIFQDLIYQYN
jgi:hypothetical protein